VWTVRGGKPLKMSVRGESVEPDLSIAQVCACVWCHCGVCVCVCVCVFHTMFVCYIINK